eukprot:975325_1
MGIIHDKIQALCFPPKITHIKTSGFKREISDLWSPMDDDESAGATPQPFDFNQSTDSSSETLTITAITAILNENANNSSDYNSTPLSFDENDIYKFDKDTKQFKFNASKLMDDSINNSPNLLTKDNTSEWNDNDIQNMADETKTEIEI